jgi:hypothetical protein
LRRIDIVKRKIFVVLLAAVLLLSGGVIANAQFRLDANIQVPFYMGINLAAFGASGVSGGTSITSFLPFPSVEGMYQFGSGPLRFGVGLRAYTFIIESIAWPDAFVELELSPVVIRADVGGGAWLLFGLYNNADTAAMVIPQLDVAFKLADWFRLGVGAIAVAPFQHLDNFGYAIYASGRFTVLFK